MHTSFSLIVRSSRRNGKGKGEGKVVLIHP